MIVFLHVKCDVHSSERDVNVITSEMITTQVQTLEHNVLCCMQKSKWQNIELGIYNMAPEMHAARYAQWFTMRIWKMLLLKYDYQQLNNTFNETVIIQFQKVSCGFSFAFGEWCECESNCGI